MLAWSCAVLFSDNAADFAALKQLTEQRNALAARRDEMEACFSANARACQVCQLLWLTLSLDCCKLACMMHPTERALYEAPFEGRTGAPKPDHEEGHREIAAAGGWAGAEGCSGAGGRQAPRLPAPRAQLACGRTGGP